MILQEKKELSTFHNYDNFEPVNVTKDEVCYVQIARMCTIY